MKRIVFALTLSALLAAPAAAQESYRNDTIEGVMTELYAAVTREPGEPFGWHRLRAVTLPGTIMVPQVAQRSGKLEFMTVDQFIDWIDTAWKPLIGTNKDQGFFERQTHMVVHQYGDIANVFSTYEKGPFTPRSVSGRGINAIQLIRSEGRWYVLSITWDEENTAGRIPAAFL